MFLPLVLTAPASITWTALSSLIPSRRPPVPVYVMLPLSATTTSLDSLRSSLPLLAAAGTTGVMLDVWWGLCEPAPGAYDFAAVREVATIAAGAGLKLQVTLSLHACGGNVGDTVNIPLPAWVEDAADEHGLWYEDRQGHAKRECLAIVADDVCVLPSKDGSLRTPLEAYQNFIDALLFALGTLLFKTVVELQVGCGPCGELRYPSYPLQDDMWVFPGVGELQCFSKRSRAALASAAADAGLPEDFGVVPVGTGSYNDKPGDTEFWGGGVWRSERGRFFLRWYAAELRRHGREMLSLAKAALGARRGVSLALKVSGVHWWRSSPGRAAEASAGYVVDSGESAYVEIARLCKEFGAVLDFTCLEMRTCDQPYISAGSSPRQLVREVFRAVKGAGVRVAGENALERYDWGAYQQMMSAFDGIDAESAYGFTLLRLGDTLLEEENFKVFKRFVKEMQAGRA